MREWEGCRDPEAEMNSRGGSGGKINTEEKLKEKRRREQQEAI